MALFGSKVSDIIGNRKIDREISDLEMKKQSLIKSVQNEVNAMQVKITGIFTEIGSEMYSSHSAGDFSIERFTEKFSAINALKETITEKEAKISEISSRYDEEITLLRNLNPPASDSAATAAPAQAADAPPSAGNCGSCGAPLKADAIFCRSCGAKLAK